MIINPIFIIIFSLFISLFVNAQATGQELKSGDLATPLNVELKLSGEHRFRYETLDGQFRNGRNGSDQILAFRTILKAAIKFNHLKLIAEMLDSRQALADQETTLNNGIVNILDLLQGYVAIDVPNLLHKGGKSWLQVGRQTMNIGSRRLMARNRFRNTINNFTGINGTWQAASGERVQAFYFFPVNRLPSDKNSLLDNNFKFDEENFDVQLWGLYSQFAENSWNVKSELYLFKLNENDNSTWATRNRNFYTVGSRFYRKSAVGQFDFEIESVLQRGTSRASKIAIDTNDLEHSAHFQHLQMGYTFARLWSPRLVLQFDYASGDKSPNDQSNNRFDTLYGARRFDFGPTGIYGAFARHNLVSPGYRLIIKPRHNLNLMFAHRFYQLASAKDAWTTSGLSDSTGNSGKHIGNQAEIRIRWEVIPHNIRFETGAAYLFAGEFMENAPNSNQKNDANYLYLQTIFTF